MTIRELANKICEELPEHWTISLDMEYGSGSWVLVGPSGVIPFEDVCSVDDAFEAQPLKMLAYAIASAAPEE